ncbi:MAG: hypothetical protein RLY43_2348, partial [Bacteroidota bacterium]
MNKIIILGDAHFPWVNKMALDRVYQSIEKEKPDVVLQQGDLYDSYSFSKYSKNLDYIAPKNELVKAREGAAKMWKEIQTLAPKAKCYQLLGNHDERMRKRINEKLPEFIHLFDKVYKDLYTFSGVHTMQSESTELKIDNIMFIHGYLSKLGDHMKKNLMNTVVGHSHTGGVVYRKQNNSIIWELNVGFLANDKAMPLQYGKQKT